MAVPLGIAIYTEFLKSKEYFRFLFLLYPKNRESKWISKRFYNQGGMFPTLQYNKTPPGLNDQMAFHYKRYVFLPASCAPEFLTVFCIFLKIRI